MKAIHVVLVALMTAAALTAVAAAGPQAATQRVAITSQAERTTTVSAAALTPLGNGALRPDAGSFVASPGSQTSPTHAIRDGQSVEVYSGTGTFRGRRGRIVMRIRQEYVDAGNGYHPATGTWKVLRGTGAYEGITGGGRLGHVWLEWNDHWSSRLEGFLTLSKGA